MHLFPLMFLALPNGACGYQQTRPVVWTLTEQNAGSRVHY